MHGTYVDLYNRSMASPSINDDQAEILRVLNEYYSAFGTLKIEAVLPYFHEPSLLIGPQGVFAATTHTLLATVVTPTIEDLRARGLGRTELSVRNLKLLSATAALVGGVAQLFRLGWKWRRRCAAKIAERTREEDTKALYG